MLYRKIESYIESYLQSDSNRVLIVDGARQIGKSFIIRHAGQKLYKNYIEVNMEEDKLGDRIFADAKTVNDFYLALSVIAGDRMRNRADTLVFIDEIQAYEHLLTLLKFLKEDNRFTYIASGSLLGVTLRNTSSIPLGSIEIKHMYPMDFEEFLIANGVGELAISTMRIQFLERQPLPDSLHAKMLDLFKKYLIVGGLPDAVKTFVEEKNVMAIRKIQEDILTLYGVDASKYEKEHAKKITDQDVLDAATDAHEKLHLVKSKGGIVVRGIHDVAVRFSKCCSPIPGDEIVGFVTRGRGITIHRTDCINVLNMSELDRSRLIEAEWQSPESANSETYMAEIQIYANNRTGLLVDLSKIFTERKIDVRGMSSRTSKQEKATISMSFNVKCKEELNTLIEKIRQVDSVIDVERTTG